MATTEPGPLRVAFAGAVGLGLGMAAFGLISDGLEGNGAVGDGVGHLVGLPIAFCTFVASMGIILHPPRTNRIMLVVAMAAFPTLAYLAGFGLIGPPVDFVASICVAGI